METAERVRIALEALAPTPEKVDLAVKTALDVARPSRVILFGSWTRGEAKWDSDLDMAVLMPDLTPQELGEIYRKLRRRLDQVPMSIDLVMATEGHAAQFADSINSIYYRILSQGQIAYERPAARPDADTAHQSL